MAARTYLKFKVTESKEINEVREITRLWAKLRQTPRHLTRAIRLYEALRCQDIPLFLTLLGEFFPGFALAEQLRPAAPLGTIPLPVAPVGRLTVEKSKRSAEEMVQDDDTFGFGDMDF